MSHKIVKPLVLAIGTGLVGSLSLAQVAQANPSFHMNSLVAGYSLAVAGEGKCGEGKCSVAKMGKPGDTAVSAADAKAHGFSDSQIKAWDKNSDGKLDDGELKAMHASMDHKGKEGSCSAEKKGKEGSCSAEKKGKEGSCSGEK
ncbi:MAG: hypothetical protein E6K53_00905, partial [Gammaproteobacteria bacterium]